MNFHTKHVIYFILYLSNTIMELLVTRCVLDCVETLPECSKKIVLYKYILTFTKVLLIMEVSLYSKHFFYKSIAFQQQIKITRIFSIIFSLYLGFMYEYCNFIIFHIILQIITLFFLIFSMENRNDIIFHSYNRKIGIDYLKIKLHVVDEMINSCKNASLIWSVFLIMTDFFSTGRNPFCVFHILKFLVLYIDYLLYKSHLDRLSFFQWTNMLMGTMWFFGILVIVPLTIKFGL